jgi:hypothetical protein
MPDGTPPRTDDLDDLAAFGVRLYHVGGVHPGMAAANTLLAAR